MVEEALEVCRRALEEAGIPVGKNKGTKQYRDGRMTVAEKLDEVRFLMQSGESLEQIAKTLNWKIPTIADAAYRRGYIDVARPFMALYSRQRYARLKLDKQKAMR
jgi:hypothetical protein